MEIDFVPVRLARLIEPTEGGGKPGKMGPRKQANYMGDVLHWARFIGVDMSPNARDLIRTDTQRAMRCTMVLKAGGEDFGAFHHAAYRARWSEARDLSQEEVLVSLLEKAGLDAQDVLARADAEGVQSELEAETDRAIERGVFGVPTLFVGDELFFGNDRFELVHYYAEQALAG